MPDQTINKDLYDLVKLHQFHQHSKSKPCFITLSISLDRPIVAVLLDQSVDILEKTILTKCNNILLKVKEFFDLRKASYINI